MKNFLVILFCFALMCITGACEKVDNGNNDDLPTSTPLPPMADPNDVCTSMDDLVFMKYCYEHFDVNKDGKVSRSEAAAVKEISVSSGVVRSFTGIGYFSNLENFDCSRHDITELDLSNNLNLKSIYCSDTYLKSIDLRYNKQLSDFLFSYCNQLSSVLFPNINLEVLPDEVFRDCTSLVTIDIPKTVTNIGNYAFAGCTSLAEIVLPDTIVNIGAGAFEGCTKMSHISLPPTLKSIEYSSFAYSGLEQIEIPQGITSIQQNAFTYCELLYKVVLPNTVKSIGYYAFYGCGKLEVNLPVSLVAIDSDAFNKCRIEHVIIPENVTSIGRYAFTDVGVLELTNLENLVYDPNFCLDDCKLDILIIHDKHFPELNIDSQLNDFIKKPILYVHTNLVNEWKEKAGEYFSEILPIETM